MKSNKIVKNSIYLMIMVLAGKILGFFKQIIIAWKYGTAANLDVYFTADSYISMFGQILAVSIPPAIVSVYLKIKGEKVREEQNDFINSILVFFTLISLFLMTVNILLSPFLSKWLGISYTFEQQNILIRYLKYLCPIIFLSCISSVSSGVLQSKNSFLQDKLLGILLSISIIAFTIVFESKLHVDALVYGFIIGYLLFAIIMTILLLKNIKLKYNNPFKNKTFKKFLKILIPLIIGVSIVDISHLIDKIIASSLEVGSVSSLYYGQIVCSDLVNGVIIASLGVVLLPKLTKDVEIKNDMEISEEIKRILEIMIPITLFITLLYLTIGKDFVAITFERGKFTSNSTMRVYECVIGYSLGLVFIMLKEILSKFMYAKNDTINPMISNICGIIANIILSILLSRKMGVHGIAIATSISIIISDIVLIIILKIKYSGIKIIDKKNLIELLKLLICIFLTGLVGKYVYNFKYVYRLIRLFVTFSVMAICLFLLFKITKIKALNYFKILKEKNFKIQN